MESSQQNKLVFPNVTFARAPGPRIWDSGDDLSGKGAWLSISKA